MPFFTILFRTTPVFRLAFLVAWIITDFFHYSLRGISQLANSVRRVVKAMHHESVNESNDLLKLLIGQTRFNTRQNFRPSPPRTEKGTASVEVQYT
jgi:hypothetical protein